MDKPRKVSVQDLTSEQLEGLEDELGIPVNRWGSEGSVVRQMRRVLETGNGVESGTYKSLSAKDILEIVSLDDSEPDPNP